jgi:hypothetical protein
VQTLNQLLTEMDGFEGNTGVIVVAATNRADILDSALLRPGRFDRQVSVDVPDMKGRVEILKVHAKNKKLEEGVDLEEIAARTPGFSGADLANLLNEVSAHVLLKGFHTIPLPPLACFGFSCTCVHFGVTAVARQSHPSMCLRHSACLAAFMCPFLATCSGCLLWSHHARLMLTKCCRQ